MEDLRPVYAISVAAELAGMHPQTLRQYDRLGLVCPQRVKGRNRLYSARDVERLREVGELSAAGVSLEGIRRVLELQAEVDRLRDQVDSYAREKRSTALVLYRPQRRRGA
ncbi:MAG: heat shock protein transcriptional repressor HspR [Candidatus Nanopelagicales bacterium]|jgi:MerR family transcriptional regulator/heat shock protein HspR